jgi:hypothetical protein
MRANPVHGLAAVAHKLGQALFRLLHHAYLCPELCCAVQVYLTAGVTVGLVQGVMAQLPHTSNAQQH